MTGKFDDRINELYGSLVVSEIASVAVKAVKHIPNALKKGEEMARGLNAALDAGEEISNAGKRLLKTVKRGQDNREKNLAATTNAITRQNKERDKDVSQLKRNK